MVILCLHRYLQHAILAKPWKVHKTNKRSAVDVAYKIYGPDPSKSSKHIIVLHGLLGCNRNWASLSKIFASSTNACVVAPDARNHGDSPHNSSHTYHDLAADVSQLIKKLSIDRAHIIGHSMGGRTGMTLALIEPSKVLSLVVVDISPITAGPANEFFINLFDVMKSVNFKKASNISKAREIAKDTMLASKVIDNMEGMGFIMMNIGQLANESFGWKYNLDALKNYFINIATFPPDLATKQYSGPTLFVGGDQSDYLPESDLPKIKLYFPKAELKYIENAGHNVHAENPKDFTTLVNSFLSLHL